jgi:hypothetical protein
VLCGRALLQLTLATRPARGRAQGGLPEGKVIKIPKARDGFLYNVHVVAEGDTLPKIAQARLH